MKRAPSQTVDCIRNRSDARSPGKWSGWTLLKVIPATPEAADAYVNNINLQLSAKGIEGSYYNLVCTVRNHRFNQFRPTRG